MAKGPAKTTIGVKIDKSKGNLLRGVEWLEYLTTPEYKEDVRETMRTKGRLTEIEMGARKVIEEDIYNKYKGYQGEGNIADSMTAVEDDRKTGTTVLYSDPSVAEAKLGPQFSYAAFFEKPIEFNSFIGDEDEGLSKKRYRPFFDQLTEMFMKMTEKHAMQAHRINISKRMPKTTKRG